MTESGSPLTKVLFHIPNETPDGITVETLWAFGLGNDEYMLDNTPWWAYGVSCGDIVFAPYDETDVLDDLNRLGANYEGMNWAYLAVEIPAVIDYDTITEYLTDNDVMWERADPVNEVQ